MARTMKYLERKAMEAYAEFAENPNCYACQFGYSIEFPKWVEDLYNRKRRQGLENGFNCEICPHFFEYEVVNNSACPCTNIGHDEAIKMLLKYVKKWRKEGLI